MPDARRAPRLVVNAPAVVESIGQLPMPLHPNLAKVFRRVEADQSSLGTKFPAVIRDLSTNGAFISGVPLPLMSRVAIKMDVKGLGSIDAIDQATAMMACAVVIAIDDQATVVPCPFSLGGDERSAERGGNGIE